MTESSEPPHKTHSDLVLTTDSVIRSVALTPDQIFRSIVIAGSVGNYLGYCSAMGWETDKVMLFMWEKYAIEGLTN